MITRETAVAAFPSKPLGEVANFLDSRRRPVKQSERKPGPFPYYGANGQQGTIDDYIFDEPLILLAEDGGCFDEPDRGIAYRIFGKTWVNNHAHVIRPKEGLDFDFLARVLQNYDVRPFINGSTRSKLTKSQAEEIPIPLPPLAEQKRIAAILDQADALRRLRQRAIARLDTLGQAIFHEMFGDLDSSANRWKLVDLSSVSVGKPNNGIFRKNDEYITEEEGGIPVVWVDNLFHSNKIIQDNLRRLRAEEQETAKYGLKYGDLLFCRSSLKRDGIAYPNVYLGSDDSVLFECHLIRVSPNKNSACPIFLNFLFRTPSMRARFIQKSKTSTMTTIDQASLSSVEFPLPPIDRQLEFSKKFKKIEAQVAISQSSIARSSKLFGSLQHRAFRGEL